MTIKQQVVRIAVINYQGALQSAIHGFSELFSLANRVCGEHKRSLTFVVETITSGQSEMLNHGNPVMDGFQALILPPSIESWVYNPPDPHFKNWLVQQHSSGTIMCSVCSGAFILGATGLLHNRQATTHWGLAAQFSQKFPEICTNAEKILINDGDIITAGGIMAWVDLGLELVAQFAGSVIMRQLCRLLVVDSGVREQRYYQSFSPPFDHGDKDILSVQHYLQTNFRQQVTIAGLSDHSCLTERTFLRRFVRATGFKPVQYLQRLRIQKACDLIETTAFSLDTIARKVGYEDTGAFRKIFVKITGLTPGEFKKRFACQPRSQTTRR